MRLHPPTHAAASANAARCIRQRMRLHPPTQRAASANACGCIRQRMRLHPPTHASGQPVPAGSSVTDGQRQPERPLVPNIYPLWHKHFAISLKTTIFVP